MMFKFLTSLFATQSVRRFGPPSPVLGRPSPPSPGLLGTPSPPMPGLLGTPSPPSPGLLGTPSPPMPPSPSPSLVSGTVISCLEINTVCNNLGFENCLLLDDTKSVMALETSCGYRHGDAILINGTLIEVGKSGCYEFVNITECQLDSGLIPLSSFGTLEQCGDDYYAHCLVDLLNGRTIPIENFCDEALKNNVFYFIGEITEINTIYLRSCWTPERLNIDEYIRTDFDTLENRENNNKLFQKNIYVEDDLKYIRDRVNSIESKIDEIFYKNLQMSL